MYLPTVLTIRTDEVLHLNYQIMEQLTLMHWICVDVYCGIFFPTETCVCSFRHTPIEGKEKVLYSPPPLALMAWSWGLDHDQLSGW